jgi:AcrR family transcriptional regulator
MPTPTQAEKKSTMVKSEATRARILESALAIFRERGFEKSTMREIATAAGVAVGAAYYYFDSKDAIVMAFYQRAQQEMAPSLDAILSEEKTLEARLRGIITYKFEYFSPNRALLGALSGHADPAHALSPFSQETAAIREQDVAFFPACRGRLQGQTSLQHSTLSAALTLAVPNGPASLLGLRPLTQANPHPDPLRQDSEDDADHPPPGRPAVPAADPPPRRRVAGSHLWQAPQMIRFEETTFIAAPIDRVFDLSRSVEVHLLANVHGNEQALATGEITTGLVDLGQQVTWRAKHFRVLAQPDQ